MCPVSGMAPGHFGVYVAGSRRHLRINKRALYEMI